MTTNWAYKLIVKVGESLEPRLRRELGLDQPFKDPYGKTIADEIHLWCHWFRSQRASQLKFDYHFSESQLMEWFAWLDFKTAQHYAHLGYEGLAEAMRNPMPSKP